MKKNSLSGYLLLHIMVAVMSVAAVCSKSASGYSFLSAGFILFYGLSLLIMFIYAFGWQQVLKRNELTAAYSARAASVVWVLFWGMVIFHEKLTVMRVIGIVLVLSGLILYFSGNKEDGK